MRLFTHKLRNRILLAVLPVLVVILVFHSIYYYQALKSSHLERYNESRQTVESHIVDTITLIDAGYRMLENRLESELSSSAKGFLEAYTASGGKMSHEDLLRLQQKFGKNFDFMLIDKTTTISDATVSEALNFNFNQFDEQLGKKINQIRAGNSIWFEQLRTNVGTGKLSKFAYIPAPDHQYLLEVGYSIDGMKSILDELKPQSTINALKASSPLIKDIRLFDAYGYQVVDSGQSSKPTPEILQVIQKVKAAKTYEIHQGPLLKRYLYIPLNQKREKTMANTDKVVEIVYDTQILDKQLTDLRWTAIIVNLTIILFLGFVIVYFSRILSKPLESLTESAKKITHGDYDTRVQLDSEGEVGELSKAFNTMATEISRNFAEIEAQKAILEDYSHSLEEKVQDRTRELAKQKEVLEEKNKELEVAWLQANNAAESKSSFLAMMSHEIRTPINGVIGMAYLILRTKLTPRQRDYVHKIKSSGENLLEIINDVLDISKLEAGKTELESIPFHLDEVFELISTQIGYRAAEKGLEMVFSSDSKIPANLCGDPLRLRQVLLNLVNNAVKFTDTGEILVSTRLLEETPEGIHLEFTVSDTGIGIPPEKLEQLFQPFQQADASVTRKYGGTGLGLSISRHFIELMKGAISVESTPGLGTTFRFTGWFAHCLGTVPTPVRSLEETKHLNVLLVDDCSTTREVLVDMLSSTFRHIQSAASGAEALQTIEASEKNGHKFDVVLMDWKMPDMDGIEAAFEIKKRSKMYQVPAILMLTSYDLDEAKKNAKSRNIDAFISKPIIRTTLIQTILQAVTTQLEPDDKTIDPIHHLVLANPLDQVSILLAEDNSINQQIVRELLEQPGITVDTVNNGLAAIAALSEKAYDLILMDIQMPELDGLETTRRIRSMERFKNIPIIAMTAHALDEDRARAQEAGMNDYLSKPITEQALYSSLIRWSPKPLKVDASEPQEADEEQRPNVYLKVFQPKVPLENLKGNWPLYMKLLSDFYTAYRDSNKTLDYLLDIGDYEQALAIVHGIRGIAGNLGAMDLFIVAQALESDLKKDSVQPTYEGYLAFKGELSRAMEEIEVIRSKEGTSQVPTGNFAHWDRDILIQELKKHLKEGSSESLLMVSPLVKQLHHLGFETAGEALRQQIENYDFDEAFLTLEHIEKELKGGTP